jgi:hypothetical protein
LSDAPPPPSLEEVRARLRSQGYLDAGIERAIFSAPKASGAILPSAVTGALAGALASAAAAWARGAVSPPAGGLAMFAVLAALELPLAIAAGGLLLLASRSLRAPAHPAESSLAAAAAAALVIFALFTLGARSLPPSPGAHPWLALAVVTFAAFYFARAVRATSLSLALRRHVAVPGRLSGRRAFAAAVAVVLAIASASAWPRKAAARFPVLTISPRDSELVVVGLDGVTPETLALIAPDAPLFTWRRAPANPPEAWTTIATGVPPERHGVAAFDRISLFGRIALSPPAGTGWAFRGPLDWAGVSARMPVSAGQRRAYAFWEIAARAGIPTLAVNWWASEPVPGASVVENREIALQASSGREDDAAAIARFERLRITQPRVSAIYLPGADIEGGPPTPAAQAFLAAELVRARAGREILWLVADSGRSGTAGGWAAIDPMALPGRRASEAAAVAPSIIARLGVPSARDVAAAPAFAAFRPGALETSQVAAYGDRRREASVQPTETGREYLEKLKSLGYLK